MKKKIIYYLAFPVYLTFGFIIFIAFKFTKNILRSKKAKEKFVNFYYKILPRFPKKPAPPLMPAKTIMLNFAYYFLGDNIIFSSFIAELKKNCPDIKLIVLTNAKMAPFLARNPNIEMVICRQQGIGGFFRTISKLNSYDIDIVFDHTEINFELYRHILFYLFLKYKNLIAMDKAEPFVSVGVPWEVNAHITEMPRRVAAALGFKMPDNPKYQIYLTEDERKKAAAIKACFKNKKLLIINPGSSNKMRDISAGQVEGMYKFLDGNYKNIQIVFTGLPHVLDELSGRTQYAYIPRDFTLFDTLALLETADILISPDTGIAHAATAFAVPSFILYAGPDNREQGRIAVWHPNNPKSVLLQAKGEESVADIPMDKILPALKDFLDKYGF